MTPIPIIADDRERAVIDRLRARPDFALTVRRLPLGDYDIDNRFLFERKTLPDLVESIKSGRLFAQSLKLAQVRSRRPALVLEGTSKDVDGSGMKREAVQGALITVALFIGLPVLRTRTVDETIQTFAYAAIQGEAAIHGALPRHGRRPKGKLALQNHLLQGLPYIGTARAAQLLARFGSVRDVMLADEAALTVVPGIGSRIAQKLLWAIEEPPPCQYLVTTTIGHGAKNRVRP